MTQMQGMIGLEIHTYLVTKEKLFCSCPVSRVRGLQPNTNICPICTGQPGSKPLSPNLEAVKKAIQIALMLGCVVNHNMPWQRKHYDWPDMPKGYQTTLSGTHATPLGINGNFMGITIDSMHLEEDPASWDPQSGEVDYNRSGLPLVEIVTAPEFSTSEEVIDWLKRLIHNLAYLKSADTNAGIKVDVNVSIPSKSERVEIKNINSLENIKKAIEYELNRQSKEGGTKRETRRFDDKTSKTQVMRTKEGHADYRFISDPDLPTLILSNSFVNEIKLFLPEPPEIKLDKLIKQYKIDPVNAQILARNLDVVEFFEQVSKKIDPLYALPWITIELLRLLNENDSSLDKADINPEHFASLIQMVKENKITPLQGKQILKQFYPASFMPSQVPGKITNESELKEIIKKVLDLNQKAKDNYLSGETKALEFLMGEIMKFSNKRADFKLTRTLLLNILQK